MRKDELIGHLVAKKTLPMSASSNEADDQRKYPLSFDNSEQSMASAANIARKKRKHHERSDAEESN